MPKQSLIEIALTLCVAMALFGCERAPKSNGSVQHYETRRIVRGISPDRSIIDIQHENIPSYMPSMTMPFSARDQKEIVDLRLGDASFAAGDPKEIEALTEAFAVYVQTEGGTISHGLATALVDPQGNIVKIWRGNGWTPTEIIAEIDKNPK